MNNFSPLPAAANDSRLSSPEAVAPNAPSAALQARRQKLRRIVAWVVGGATLLMCAGLVRAAIRSHSESESTASSTAAAPVAAPQPVAAVTPAVPNAAAAPGDAVAAAPAPSGVAVSAPQVARKTSAHSKAAKPAKRGTVAKSVRH